MRYLIIALLSLSAAYGAQAPTNAEYEKALFQQRNAADVLANIYHELNLAKRQQASALETERNGSGVSSPSSEEAAAMIREWKAQIPSAQKTVDAQAAIVEQLEKQYTAAGKQVPKLNKWGEVPDDLNARKPVVTVHAARPRSAR